MYDSLTLSETFRVILRLKGTMSDSNIQYISKRLIQRSSKRAFKNAAKEAMEVNGYVVVVKDGWVVKEFKNGCIERMVELDKNSANQELVLD